MGFDNDCIVNIQSLAGEYFCPVCHLLVYPNEALQAQCTHLYCKPCLTYVVSTTHACPYDGYRVTEAECKPLLESNKTLADTIGKIQVHCLYYRTGCTWQGSLSECTSHCSTCSYGESPVLCNRCGVQIVHRQVQEHAQNCPGVQSQAQQPSTVQDSTSTGAIASADQSQTAAQTGLSASQASAPLVSGQDVNQAANSGAQPQAAQAAMPTAEQWYHQQQQYQQQYQQYYQQYPGYDPYQQQYQYYYQYQQGVQQPQQPVQGYPPQAQAQAQAQVSGQAPPQSQLQGQQQVQPHSLPQPQQQPQAPSQPAQPLSQTNAQLATNAQPQAQSVGQGQPQMQAQGQAPPSLVLPYNQAQPLPYAQPQPQQQIQPMQVPHYQQTHPQVQHPHAQTYPPTQTQAQHYPYAQPQSQMQPQPQSQMQPQPQSQMQPQPQSQIQPQPQSQIQPQPHSQPTMQAPARPPSQHNQPMNPNTQLQTHASVTGYQSYPQPQPHPSAQVGAAHPMHVSGAQQQPQYPGQVQGKFPSQPSQMYPPHPYSNVANQQLPVMSSAQVQPPSGPPAQQVPVYPNGQQPGYPLQHRPGMQTAQQAAPQHYGQQQSFAGHGPFTQPQPAMPGQLHAQGPPQTLQQSHQNNGPGYGALPNTAQSYAARPVAAQVAGPQPYAQGAGFAGTGQVRPPLPNQSYPIRTDNQLSATSEQQAGLSQQSSRATVGERPRDQMLVKSIHDQNDPNKEVRDFAGASGTGIQANDIKVKPGSSTDGIVNGNESRAPGSDVEEHKPRIKGDASEGISEPSPGNSAAKKSAEDHKAGRKAEVQELKRASNSTAGAASNSNLLVPQDHGTNSLPSVDQGRNQQQTMQYGPSGQHRPGAVPMPQTTPHPFNSQQPASGQPPGQLRPQGPGQVPSRLPSNAAENSQLSIPKHLPGHIPHEHASGVPGLSGPFVRPGNMGYYQGPPFAAQRPGAFDSHAGIEGRERADVEQRPPYPTESEKFQAQRPGYFDGRKPESLPHGMERVPYGSAHQHGAMKFVGPSAHGAVSGMRDERAKPFPEEHLKPYPQRDFEDDLRKFPRSSHFEAGPLSKHGTQFPSSGPLDHGRPAFGSDGMSRPFDKSQHGFDRDGPKMGSGVASGPPPFLPPFHPNDVGERGRAAGFPDDNMGRGDFGHRADFSGSAPGPGFGRSRMDGLPLRSPGRDFSGFPSRAFGAYDDGGNESHSFEGSRPYNFPSEPFGKSIHENRFPVPPNHLQRGELDGTGNMRMGEHFVGGPRNQDMLPSHLRSGEHMGPRNLHMGEPPLAGNFPQHIPFGESFGGEKPGHPLVGEPGFRGSSGFQRYPQEGGFYPEEMDPFENPRKRKPGSIMCRICKVDCGTVDGLELHSQSREHQRKAMDMVLNIKQQNKKKLRTSKGQAFVDGRDGGRPKNSSFQGRGNKR